MSPIASGLPAEFSAALADVRRPGDFFTFGVAELRAPSINVAGVGPIALPLLEDQAKRLIASAKLAPYGRREETLVDTSVRRCWQIGADRVEITGARWRETLTGIVARAAEGLGVDGLVEAVFYKLLIYEKGGFFVGHRDTEKCPGMFATLIVAPPGIYSGGQLVVRHAGREARLDLNAADPAEVAFAAFYADCIHEVLPVETGYRLVLIYNLARKGKGPSPQPPNYDREARRVAALLNHWRGQDDTLDKIVYPLEHAYTPAELSFAALKGADAAIAKTVADAAREADCDLNLALLTVEESGAADYKESYGSRRGRWRDAEDEFEAGEVFEHSATLTGWRQPDDGDPKLPTLTVADAELSPPRLFDELEPDEEYFGEATGNEGASFERTYRRAALVLWPHERFLRVVAGADLGAALAYLENLVEQWTRSADDEKSTLHEQARTLAGEIVARRADDYWRAARATETTAASLMLKLLTRLDDSAGIENFLTDVLAERGFETRDAAAILDALSRLEESRFKGIVERLLAGAAAKFFAACANLLRRATQMWAAEDFRAAASHLLAAMPIGQGGEPEWRAPKADPAAMADMLAALRRIDAGAAMRATERMLGAPKTFGFDAVLVPALRLLARQGELAAGDPALEKLRAACLSRLRARAAEPSAPPADWRRPSDLACKCRDCMDFARFLDDPARKMFALKAAEPARSHLEQTIASARSDVDAVTERKGRPYSLVCVKNQASYDRRVVQRKEDIENISVILG